MGTRILTRYGILDDEDRVIRWVWHKPGPAFRFIIQRLPQKQRQPIDWNNFEESPL